MDLFRREPGWAFPFIFGIFALLSLCAHTTSAAAPSSASAFRDVPAAQDASEPGAPPDAPVAGYRSYARMGVEALRENKSDSALEWFMEAGRLGMSRDSLCYFLAETALLHSAYDTAMAFNLSIPSPASGPFRESVLGQRYRLYVKAGLTRDAAGVADSMGSKPGLPASRKRELDLMLSSGYFREDDYAAGIYPFGGSLAGYRFAGSQFRQRGRLLWPLPISGARPVSGGFRYDVSKSYAKDSLDFRAGVELKADNLPLDSISITAAADIGKVSGAGLISAYKIESSFLSLSGTGITLIQGGLESEWNDAWESRFGGFWVSWYRDRSLASGRGFNFSLSASGILVDPIREGSLQKVMYVDDVSKSRPTHYRDGTYQDTIPSRGISTFIQYTSNTGAETYGSVSTQAFVTVLPTLGYSFPLPGSLSGEVGGCYVLTVYPQSYRWTEAAWPDGLSASAGDFRGLALNRADGKRYAAVLVQENGGFREYYGASPEKAMERTRIDQQLGADLSLRRKFGKWGGLSLEAQAKRNWSTLAGIAPIWIPDWDWGASLVWRLGWSWI